MNTFFYKKNFFIFIFSFYGVQTPFAWGMNSKTTEEETIRCPLLNCNKKWNGWNIFEITKHFYKKNELEGHYKNQSLLSSGKRIVICNECKKIYEHYDHYKKNNDCFLKHKEDNVLTWKQGRFSILKNDNTIQCPIGECTKTFDKNSTVLCDDVRRHFCDENDENGHNEEQLNMRPVGSRIGFCLECKEIYEKYYSINKICTKEHKASCFTWVDLKKGKQDKNKINEDKSAQTLLCTRCRKNITVNFEENYYNIIEHIKTCYSNIKRGIENGTLGFCLGCEKIVRNTSVHRTSCKTKTEEKKFVYSVHEIERKEENKKGLSCRLCCKGNRGKGKLILFPSPMNATDMIKKKKIARQHVIESHPDCNIEKMTDVKNKYSIQNKLGICGKCGIISNGIQDHAKKIHGNDGKNKNNDFWCRLFSFSSKTEQPFKNEEEENSLKIIAMDKEDNSKKLLCILCNSFFECTEDGYHKFVKHFHNFNEEHSECLQKPLGEQYGICLNPSCRKLYPNISKHQCKDKNFSFREVYTLNIFCQKFPPHSDDDFEEEEEEEEGEINNSNNYLPQTTKQI
jgi:hypothetical protein